MPGVTDRELYEKVFESALVAIGITNNDGRFIIVNQAWCDNMGYSISEATRLKLCDITPPEDIDESDCNYMKMLNREIRSFRKVKQYLRKDGSCFWADLNISSIENNLGEVIGVLGIFINIDQMVKAEERSRALSEKLEKLNNELIKVNTDVTQKNQQLYATYKELERVARYDSLTGIYNRRVLEDILATEIKRSLRTKRSFAIAIADLDNFKHVNDTYGHDCGNEVLKATAQIFLSSIRSIDTVGRWGGEEFLFILPETSCEGAIIVLERVRQRVHDLDFHYKGTKVDISVTIGFSYQNDNFTAENLLDESDKALYIGKRNGKNQVVCFANVC